jgi:hypothetical protein
MKAISCGIAIGLSAATFATVTASEARAGCGGNLLQPSAYFSAQPGSAGFLAAAATTPAIVGMWAVRFTSNGRLVDFGYSVWHSDRTEFLNSGGRAPATQNYCLGVWRQITSDTYRLNHLALSYDASGKLNGRARIREDVKLSADENSYKGPFTIDVYDPKTGKTLLLHVEGTIVGKRVDLTTTPAVD